MPCIYEIRNTKSGKFYIGSAKNLRIRWAGHRSQLRKGSHKNPHLQAAWNLYGEESFEISVLIECEELHLRKIEQAFLDMYVGLEWCYNVAKSATAPMMGIPCSDARRLKMRHAMTGRIRSDEHKRNLSNSLTGNRLSGETKLKISQFNLGKIESEETKNKKSKTWQGKTNNPHKQLDEDKVRYIRANYDSSLRGSRKFIVDHLGVSYKSVCDVIYRNTWTHIE